MENKIKNLLKFRKLFTKREWMEINQAIDIRLKEKADQLELDDLDLKLISERLEKVIH